MAAATTEDQDARREAALAAYEAITRQPRRELQALTELAAQILEVPMATINLITSTHQHQVAAYGFDASICSREDSMCNAVLHDAYPVVVDDARLDPRFMDNPFVTGELGLVRFYATQQLVSPEGIPFGTLCVFDTEPRVIDEEQRQALATLGERVVDVLELDRRTRDLASTVRRMAQVQEELVRSNEQLAAFAGQVSHDLRNPLTAVGMALRLLRDEVVEGRGDAPPDDDQGGSHVDFLTDRAIRATDRMRELVDELLDFARLGGEIRPVEVPLDVLLADVVADLATALEGADVVVHHPLPTVIADRTQLRALVQNLVANAVKFTEPGQQPGVDVSARRTTAGWRIEVADRGVGVPADQRERVFEPLTRADDRFPGTGIGLATAKRVVEAHGGTIGLLPREGGGTVFWFELPDA